MIVDNLVKKLLLFLHVLLIKFPLQFWIEQGLIFEN